MWHELAGTGTCSVHLTSEGQVPPPPAPPSTAEYAWQPKHCTDSTRTMTRKRPKWEIPPKLESGVFAFRVILANLCAGRLAIADIHRAFESSLPLPTSAPGLAYATSALGWAHPSHICTGTGRGRFGAAAAPLPTNATDNRQRAACNMQHRASDCKLRPVCCMPHTVPGMVLLACGVLRAVLGMRAVSDLDVVETLAKINASCAHCNLRRMLTLTCAVRCVLHVANLVCAHAQ